MDARRNYLLGLSLIAAILGSGPALARDASGRMKLTTKRVTVL